MRKLSALFFIISLLAFAACQNKPKSEEQPADTTTVLVADTAVMTNESSAGVMATGLDTTMVADTVKNN